MPRPEAETILQQYCLHLSDMPIIADGASFPESSRIELEGGWKHARSNSPCMDRPLRHCRPRSGGHVSPPPTSSLCFCVMRLGRWLLFSFARLVEREDRRDRVSSPPQRRGWRYGCCLFPGSRLPGPLREKRKAKTDTPQTHKVAVLGDALLTPAGLGRDGTRMADVCQRQTMGCVFLAFDRQLLHTVAVPLLVMPA